jgi:hypothetical protein
MTSRTRSRLMICLILGLITLPAEALLLPVARTPDPRVAAMEWAADLTPEGLQSAALQIDAYPAVYRRAIMRELDPRERAEVWRGHLRRFLNVERRLTKDQVRVVHEAIELLSEETFTPPVAADVKERISALYQEALATLGPKLTAELFVTLGPKEMRGRNALPLTQRIADRIRSWRVVSAEPPDCNCNIDIDTCDISWDPWLQCSELYSCNFDLDWPMCGPFWAWACTGWCKIIRWPFDME